MRSLLAQANARDGSVEADSTHVSDYTAILSPTNLNGATNNLGWSGGTITGHSVFVTYSFASTTWLPGHTDFVPFTAAMQTITRAAMEAWASASGIVAFEVAPGQGDIVFGIYGADPGTHADLPNGVPAIAILRSRLC